MGMLQIDDIREGMILDSDVVENGQVLIKAGVQLTDRHMRLCRSWGIKSLEIRGMDAQKLERDFMAALDPQVLQQTEQKAQKNCHWFDSDAELHKKFYQIHLHKLLEKASTNS